MAIFHLDALLDVCLVNVEIATYQKHQHSGNQRAPVLNVYPRQDSQQNDYTAQQYRSGEVANEDNTADNECDTYSNTEIDALVFLRLDSAEQVTHHNDKGQFGELRGLKRDAEDLYPTGGTIDFYTQTGESQEQKDK